MVSPSPDGGAPVAAAAESWEVSEDGKTITFTMREGVTFQSGNPVRAEDAAFSLQRAVILNKTPAFILSQFGFTPENVEEMIRVEDGKLLITTDKKYATSFNTLIVNNKFCGYTGFNG